jgi:hypothetical protein
MRSRTWLYTPSSGSSIKVIRARISVSLMGVTILLGGGWTKVSRAIPLERERFGHVSTDFG